MPKELHQKGGTNQADGTLFFLQIAELERALIAAGMKEISRGQAWSQNCREWVYFDCFLPARSIRRKFALDPCVEDHEHRGTHDGQESGFVCSVHHDGIMGHHPASGTAAPRFDPE